MGKKYCHMLLAVLLAFFVQSMANAISSEYKNYLEKVELTKTGDNNYNINLYMQKNYTSPVKVIKKNDLSYYILLPETKNLSSASGYKSSEIQSISTNLYPYAGIDVNNGYTKINISTTKPIDFNLNIKNMSAKVATKTPVAVENKTVAKLASKTEVKAESKTNSKVQTKVENKITNKQEIKQTVSKQTAKQENKIEKLATKTVTKNENVIQNKLSQNKVESKTVNNNLKPVIKQEQNSTVKVQNTQLANKQDINKTISSKTVFKKENQNAKEILNKKDGVNKENITSVKSKNTQNQNVKLQSYKSDKPIIAQNIIKDKVTEKISDNIKPAKEEVKQQTKQIINNNIINKKPDNSDIEDYSIQQETKGVENTEQQAIKDNVNNKEDKAEENKNLIAYSGESDTNDDLLDDIEEKYAYAAKIPSGDTIKTKISEILKSVAGKLSGFGIGIFPIIFAIGVIGAVVMLLILSNRQNGVRLRRKSDLLDLNKKSSLTPKKEKEPVADKDKNDGQYFVFDKNVKQTGFLDPATSAIKKNYELSAYDPDINSNYTYNSPDLSENVSEYDIIQRILKEDTYIEITPKEVAAVNANDTKLSSVNTKMESVVENASGVKTQINTETKIAKESEEKSISVTSPIDNRPKIVQEAPIVENKAQVTQEQQNDIKPRYTELYEGLDILSKVEIAPERGFMCVSYNGQKSLIGYIFDDVFVLRNFKDDTITNYDIQYRLSEKFDNSMLYIIKVADEKMIVRVANKLMKLEIIL